MLDPIITTLARYYQVPKVLPPLDPDPDCDGKPSDHMMVVFSPINAISNKPLKTEKRIKFRPLTEEGMKKMEGWLKNEDWKQILDQSCANLKANTLQNLLISKYYECFPEKVRLISNND